jgi:O-antigen ligase
MDASGPLDYETGSFWDRWVFTSLILLALLVLTTNRKIDWSRVWSKNRGLFIFFGYVGISILWSDFWFLSLKRWIHSSGVLVMGLAVISETNPLKALESVFRRCAYVLIPFSLVLIKYLPQYGRAYGRHNGAEFWTGVTAGKNELGILCAVSAFLAATALWRYGRGSRGTPERRQANADIAILGLSIYLLVGPGGGAYSATSIVITVVGLVAFWCLRRSPKMALAMLSNLKAVLILSVVLYLVFGSLISGEVSALLNRSPDLTSRATSIWPIVTAVADRHPILGTGYGNAWGVGGELSRLTGVEEAHNGYLDIYLQLGIVGCIVLFFFFMHWCSRIQGFVKNDLQSGMLEASLLMMVLINNLSETAFFDMYLGIAMVFAPMALSGTIDLKANAKENVAVNAATLSRISSVRKPRLA